MGRWAVVVSIASVIGGCASETTVTAPPKVSAAREAVTTPAKAPSCKTQQATDCARLCSGGDADSCADLGIMQAHGEHGAAKDPEAAFASYSKACELRSARGCRLVAFAYRGGTKVKKDVQAAKSFANKGCSLGDARACRLFGEITEEEGPPATAWPLAVEAYRRACNGHDAEGCGDLGRMVAFGRGTAANPAEAFPLLRTACGPEDEPSCAVLASVMLKSSPADPEALQVARASCDRGYGDSCLLAADASPNEPDSFLRKACDLAEASGCLAVAWKLAEANDFGAARPMFMKGCTVGDDDACNSLAGLLLGGRMGPRDETEALRVAKIGCDAGGEKSCDLIKSFSRYADPSRPFTTGVAGFPFGISLTEARRGCVAAQGRWLPVNGDWVCTAQPVKTFTDDAAIDLTFCGGRLCEVMAMGAHGEEPATEALVRLVDKYGDPGVSEGPGSVAIHRAACDAGDKRELRRTWYFRPPNRGEMVGRLVFAVSCGNEEFNIIYQDALGLQHRIRQYDKERANY